LLRERPAASIDRAAHPHLPLNGYSGPYLIARRHHSLECNPLLAVPEGHGVPYSWGSHTAQYPTQHGIPHGTVSHTAQYPTRHSIPHGTVSHTAW
jgi:hypothetical protein